MKRFRCILIEDDIVEQKILELNLKNLPHLELVQVFSKPSDALPLIQDGTIDLMFIDVELPEISGLEFVKSLKHPPQVILITAHSDFAIDAFEIGIVDYLLKPYKIERLLKAVSRAVEVITDNPFINESHFFLKAGRELLKFYMVDIIYVEAYGSFTKVHTHNKIVVISESISVLEDKMSQDFFLRVHKSYLVSKTRITGISSKFILMDKLKIPLGNFYRKSVEKAIGSYTD